MFGLITKFFKSSAAKRQSPFVTPAPAEENSRLAAAAGPQPIPEAGSVLAQGVLAQGDAATLSYSSILEQVPKELHGRITAAGLAGFNFSLSKAKVLEQLPQGAVKVSFGELRRAAPAGVFLNSSSHDGKLIDLPLRDLMGQLQAELFARNPRQKPLEIPGDIADLFNCKGEPQSQMRVLEKKEMAHAASLPKPAPPAPAVVAPPSRIPFAASKVLPKPAQAAVSAAPIPFPKPAAAGSSAQLGQKATVATKSSMSTPESPMVVSLASLAENWPEAIRAEIEQLGLANATCEIPEAQISPALRAGKVQYPWKQIRAWIRPSLPNQQTSSHAETSLELPLKILAPLYLQQCRNTLSTKKVSVAPNIPDVFNKVEKPAVSPAPASQSEPSPHACTAEPSAQEPSAAPSESAPPVDPPAFLTLPLALVSGNWPDQVRKDVERFHLGDAKLEVPFDVIEQGLKQGRLHFRWKEVCRWLNPAPPSDMASADLGTQLDHRVDLPLSFVAPIYLRLRSASTRKKSAPLSNIPDLFSASNPDSPQLPASQEGKPAVSARTQAPPVSHDEEESTAKTPKKPGEELAELFGEPGKRNWTPNDIVHKTSALPGVLGAMIALQDGLLVATCMPSTWKTETIAAFLPQIFGRMAQYTNELKMGELRSVTFAVDEGTLQVFNAGIIYFAALAGPDAQLPLRELNLIVKEISRHTK